MKFMKRLRYFQISIIAILFICWLSSPVYAEKQGSIAKDPDPVIAIVGSTKIRISDIENKEINELRAALYEKLNQSLRQRSLEQLGAKHPEFRQASKIKITDEEIRGFFKLHNLKERGTYDQLAPQIRLYLEAQAQAIHYDALFKNAVKRGLVVSYLQKPNEYLVRVPVETAYLRGQDTAKVMVLEFSDYQCPFCSRVQPTIKKLMRNYKTSVVFGYRHTPLPFHYEADEAAIAAECARDQGRFEPYHNLLFKNYRRINIPNIRQFAKQVGIKNLDTFNSCLDSEKYRSRMENDQKAAKEAGIKGTPGFVIGKYDKKSGVVVGEVLSGAQPEEKFVALLEKYLKKSR